MHISTWGASQFLSASLQVGAVGYVYDQGGGGKKKKKKKKKKTLTGSVRRSATSSQSPACRAM